MDALSDILGMIRLRSSVYFRADFCSPWGMQVERGPFAQFHLVVRGNCWLQSEDMPEPILLSSGDIVVFPFGDSHWIAGDRRGRRLPGRAVVEAIRRKELIFQKGRMSATLVCGHFEFDRDFRHPFIQSLPRFIHLPGTDQRRFSWLETVLQVMIQEAGADRPGAEAVALRLAEVLFIHILRSYMMRAEVNHGFFAALKDRRIHAAMKRMHSELQTDWTLERLAREVGMSRSSFAARFKQMVGMAPMEYLTTWRMHKARELLVERNLALIDIAERVGYRSEPAFIRAFKRCFGQNPGAMRREMLDLREHKKLH